MKIVNRLGKQAIHEKLQKFVDCYKIQTETRKWAQYQCERKRVHIYTNYKLQGSSYNQIRWKNLSKSLHGPMGYPKNPHGPMAMIFIVFPMVFIVFSIVFINSFQWFLLMFEWFLLLFQWFLLMFSMVFIDVFKPLKIGGRGGYPMGPWHLFFHLKMVFLGNTSIF